MHQPLKFSIVATAQYFRSWSIKVASLANRSDCAIISHTDKDAILGLRSIRARIQNQVRHRLFRQQWNIGLIKRPIAEVSGCEGQRAQQTALMATEWYPERSDSFLADPFGYVDETGSGLNILVEYFCWRRGIGEIHHLFYDQNGFGERKLILDSPFHLSYPFVFSNDGRVFFAPEHSQSLDFSAFEMDRSQSIVAKRPMIDRTAIVDGSLAFHNDMYWMFCVDESASFNTDLNIYFADSLDGPWQAHPLNPVKSDIRSARPAGTPFVHQGQLYRPAQDCSTHYGRAVTINRVDHLSRTAFRETAVHSIFPIDPQYPYGLHTVSQVGDMTLIDGARLAPRFGWLSRAAAKFTGMEYSA
jgi:hypothetical protein